MQLASAAINEERAPLRWIASKWYTVDGSCKHGGDDSSPKLPWMQIRRYVADGSCNQRGEDPSVSGAFRAVYIIQATAAGSSATPQWRWLGSKECIQNGIQNRTHLQLKTYNIIGTTNTGYRIHQLQSHVVCDLILNIGMSSEQQIAERSCKKLYI